MRDFHLHAPFSLGRVGAEVLCPYRAAMELYLALPMARPTRVLLLISSLHRGGAERQLVELATRMDPSRYEAMVALCDPHDEFGLTLPPERVFSLASPDGATLLTLARIVRLIRRVEPDIVHGFGGMMNLYPRVAT